VKKEKKEKKKKVKKEKKKKKLSTDQAEAALGTGVPAGKSKGPMTKEEWEAMEKKRKMATNYAPDEKKKRLEANMREEKEKFGTEWTWLLSGDQKIPPPHLRAEMKYQNSFQYRF